MFTQILVPTDGSKLSQKAIRSAVQLAQASGATVTGAYVIPPYEPSRGESAIYVAGLTAERYKQATQREARKALAALKVEAKLASVPCETMTVTASSPWEGIVASAKQRKSDLIVMASHGRRGLSGLVLGSETNKVLTHSKIPVLVCR
jgi:nucleotide-binding universal stress UspA family protein